ncbi:hypothetical protein PYW08_004316 [Mythimna loreyi]|uniref:Uncharacterized protein n=1 Tax=Mythimna loreyi TaxID=667449 RepID=A0ACC2QPM4_9NEOP|nr:hypothetical protein PYW08_004316 [Mythimna loreyi]
MSFQDKVVLVIGSSSGIGAATAIKFAEEGAKVAIVGRKKQKLEEVAKKCGNPLVLVADISKDEDVKRIISETLREFGKLDILINNAGIGGNVSILAENAMQTFDQVMTTNLRAIVYLTNLAAPHIVKTKGNIINISSVAAYRAIGKESFSYCTSKAALDHFTRAVAQELAESGVRVNVINPGPVVTDFVMNMGLPAEVQDAAWKKAATLTALQRVSIPEEIADLILFTASDKARGITGSSFVSDNGMLLKLGNI